MASQNYEPRRRCSHASAQLANKVVVYSGLTEDDAKDAVQHLASVHEVEVFDPCREQWAAKECKGETPATLLHDAASTSSKDALFTYGGRDGDEQFLDSLHQLSADTYKWCRLSSRGESPMPKWLSAMVACGNDLALLGGFGIPQGPIQLGSSFMRSGMRDGRGWTNEFHIYHLNKGMDTACIYMSRICRISSVICCLVTFTCAHCTH